MQSYSRLGQCTLALVKKRFEAIGDGQDGQSSWSGSGLAARTSVRGLKGTSAALDDHNESSHLGVLCCIRQALLKAGL